MKRKEEAPAKGADTVKEWMEAHPQEYAQFAARMKTEGIGGVLKLGEDALQPVQTVLGKVLSAGRAAPQMPGSGRKGSIYGRKFPAHACLAG